MPELPEVETITTELKPRLEGRRITGATVLWRPAIARPQVDQFVRQLAGQRIERVWRRGKYIILDLSSGDKLVIHLRMTGRLFLRDASDAEDKFTRLVVHLDRGQELRFADSRKFGRLSILNPGEFRQLSDSLGPEPFGKEFTLERFKEIVSHRGQRIKTVLLDQRYIVGLGNIYADEALFEAGVHPARRADSLTHEEIERLYSAIKQVLSAGIAHKGTTFDSYLDAFGKPGAHQFHLRVYRRTGQPCPRCGTPIERIVIGGRGTHFCPKCQAFTPPAASETAPPLQRVRQRQG